LYRCWTDVGQKEAGLQESPFCTLAPVDMQAFFHSRPGFRCVEACSEALDRAVRSRQEAPCPVLAAFAYLFSCRPKNVGKTIAWPSVTCSDISFHGMPDRSVVLQAKAASRFPVDR
jgi:hypothetical protein